MATAADWERPSPLIGYGDVADDGLANPMKRRATEIAAAAQLRSIGPLQAAAEVSWARREELVSAVRRFSR